MCGGVNLQWMGINLGTCMNSYRHELDVSRFNVSTPLMFVSLRILICEVPI